MRRTPALITATLMAATFSAGLCQPAHGEDTSDGGLIPRVEANAVAVDGSQSSPDTIQVKLKESSTVRIEGVQPVTEGSTLANLADSGAITDLKPMVPQSRETLQSLKAEGEQRTGKEQADLSLWLLAKVGNRSMADVLAQLNADPAVEVAMAVPRTAPARFGGVTLPMADPLPITTPDFTSMQGYAGPASSYGIEARAVAGMAGGKGQNVNITDVEWSWDLKHEDLRKLDRPDVQLGGTMFDASDTSHGTGVMGVLSGDDNGGGVTGLISGATPYLAPIKTSERDHVAPAIAAAMEKMQAGDVMLLEIHVSPGCGGSWAPVEIDPAAYDAIKLAVAKGIHVIEPAGNGTQDLDAECYGGANFPGGRGDSGAIMVGAAAGTRSGATPGTRLGFSNYGQRVNLNGWGETVVTTMSGGGDLHDAGPHRQYTQSFNGTSSASPVVAGAVGLVSSIAEAQGKTISPEQMRSVLMATGTTGPAGQRIGVLPNVKNALVSLGLRAPDQNQGPALVNGDFERGSYGWTGATSAITMRGFMASSGLYKAQLGGAGRSQVQSLETTLKVPATGGTLAYDYRVLTLETGSTPYDRMTVQVLSSTGTPLATLGTATNVDASYSYRTKSVPLNSWAGQTLKLRITATEDAYAATTFLVDNLRVTA